MYSRKIRVFPIRKSFVSFVLDVDGVTSKIPEKFITELLLMRKKMLLPIEKQELVLPHDLLLLEVRRTCLR